MNIFEGDEYYKITLKLKLRNRYLKYKGREWIHPTHSPIEILATSKNKVYEKLQLLWQDISLDDEVYYTMNKQLNEILTHKYISFESTELCFTYEKYANEKIIII